MSARWTFALLLALAGCATRPVADQQPGCLDCTPVEYSSAINKDVDILFVIDNSNGTLEMQVSLSKNFPNFVEALRSPRLNNKIPNVRIGIVGIDLGAGSYSLPQCEPGGDGGKLLSQPRIAGCVPPSKPFISYNEGVTNIKSSTKDPIQQVKEAFSCIAEIGGGGCGFEHPIESARRALQGCGTDANNDALGDCTVNPGFIRKEARLAVVFVTDEDDCSAHKPELFDPGQTSMNDPLGPLTSFRCFEFGIQCDINDRTKPGPRKGCKPAYDWLVPIQDYVSFFKGLKPAGQVVLAAIAGPAGPVEVGFDALNPVLRPSCQKSMGRAAPAIRIKALLDSFGTRGLFNRGLDKSLTHDEPVDACSADYSPALRKLGRTILASLEGGCIPKPLLTRGGGLACHAGDPIGTAGAKSVTCQQSCLEQADCSFQIQSIFHGETGEDPPIHAVPRCAPAKFADPTDTDCGDACPCWRIVPAPDACRGFGTPYRFDLLPSWPSWGTAVTVRCRQSDQPWGSAELAALPQCSP